MICEGIERVLREGTVRYSPLVRVGCQDRTLLAQDFTIFNSELLPVFRGNASYCVQNMMGLNPLHPYAYEALLSMVFDDTVPHLVLQVSIARLPFVEEGRTNGFYAISAIYGDSQLSRESSAFDVVVAASYDILRRGNLPFGEQLFEDAMNIESIPRLSDLYEQLRVTRFGATSKLR
jgi:hypothetical protein